MRLSDFRVLSFDCYGTLIDWESGIWDALAPLRTRAGAAAGMRLTKDNPISRETVRRVLFKHKSALTTPTNP